VLDGGAHHLNSRGAASPSKVLPLVGASSGARTRSGRSETQVGQSLWIDIGEQLCRRRLHDLSPVLAATEPGAGRRDASRRRSFIGPQARLRVPHVLGATTDQTPRFPSHRFPGRRAAAAGFAVRYWPLTVLGGLALVLGAVRSLRSFGPEEGRHQADPKADRRALGLGGRRAILEGGNDVRNGSAA